MDTQESAAAEDDVLRIKNSMETEEEDDDGMALTHFSHPSAIASSNPKSQITTVTVADSVKESTESENRSLKVENGKAKLLDPIERAEEFRSSLDPKFPSFVKLMVKSHVSGEFSLGIPSKFCAKFMLKEDISMTLLDEEGKEHIAKYLAGKCGLSAGWRGFVIDHKLVEGDPVVFQLIEINKFKVYIVRTIGLGEVDSAFGHLQLEACAQKSSLGIFAGHLLLIVLSVSIELQTVGICLMFKLGKAGDDTKPTRNTVVGKPKRLPLPVADQPKNCSEEADSENVEGIRFASSVPEFEDIKNVESFNIIYNDLIIDSEMSKHVRSRYYKLCCSQNSFLHKNLVPGLNCKLVAGMICETVNISDAIQSSQVRSTSRDVLQLWRKSLEAFEHLDMNVGFLLPRLDELVRLASESEQAVDLKRDREAINERKLAEE
ncbi:hypothetical protein C5167_047219 [Papaver somniferum]|uniref:TF-B3 domain-containing protein n=1 Tax=Papaver somniferum TaxID=3469 RepID=A0A4Y7LG05_PAPSO|nr:B3 domain-containing protein Os01g0234100-like isoform X1 [Papaver somniferum]RZC84433.1 hypothetical protein C5167_047219 [Papaver somniferum]